MSLRPDHPLASASASALDDPLEFLNALDPIPVEAVEPADVEELGTYGTCQVRHSFTYSRSTTAARLLLPLLVVREH